MTPEQIEDTRLRVLRAHARDMVQLLVPDGEREGLTETPNRVAKAWMEWTRGYTMDPRAVLKAFKDGGENYDEMVIVRNIPFYSTCEHHLAPFFGDATIAYIPDGAVVGLSKLPRLLDVYAKRLQVQERITTQVADALMHCLKPKGCGVILTARHMCMESRGICKRGSETVTSALRGVFTEGQVRAEFMALGRKV